MSMMAEEKRTRKWVWGCTGGCLGFIVVVGLAIFLGVRYLLAAVPVVPAETFMTRQTSGFAVVRLDARDPLLTQIPVTIMNREKVRQWVQQTEPGQQLTRQNVQEVLAAVGPAQLAISLYPGQAEDGKLHGGAAFATRKGSGMIRLQWKAITMGQVETSSYKGTTIAAIEQKAYTAVRGNNVLSADRRELVETWIDRIIEQRGREKETPDGEQPPGPPLNASEAMEAAYGRLDTSQPLLLAVLNTHGELAALTKPLRGKPAGEIIERLGITDEEVRAISAQIRPINSRDGELTLFIEMADEGAAEDMRERLEVALEKGGESVPVRDAELTVDGPILRAEGRLQDLPDRIADLVVRALERIEKEREQQERPAPQGPAEKPAGGPEEEPADGPSEEPATAPSPSQ